VTIKDHSGFPRKPDVGPYMGDGPSPDGGDYASLVCLEFPSVEAVRRQMSIRSSTSADGLTRHSIWIAWALFERATFAFLTNDKGLATMLMYFVNVFCHSSFSEKGPEMNRVPAAFLGCEQRKATLQAPNA
jgi:hypothetical protein